MPYAQVSDVGNLLPHVQISNDTKPSSGTVADWIADIEASLDAVLGSIGYVVPVVDPASVRILKLRVATVVAAMVARSLPNPPIDPDTFQRVYDSWLKALRDPSDPTTLPPGAATTEEIVVKDTGSIIRFRSSMIDELDDDSRVSRDQVF